MGATFKATICLGVCGLAFVALALVAQATVADTQIPRIASCLDPRSPHVSPLASKLQAIWTLQQDVRGKVDLCVSIIGDEGDYRQAQKITLMWFPGDKTDVVRLTDPSPPSVSEPAHEQCVPRPAGVARVKAYIADFTGRIIDCETMTW